MSDYTHQKSFDFSANRRAFLSKATDRCSFLTSRPKIKTNWVPAICQLAEQNGQKLQQLPWLTSLRLIPMKWLKNRTPNPNPGSQSITLPPLSLRAKWPPSLALALTYPDKQPPQLWHQTSTLGIPILCNNYCRHHLLTPGTLWRTWTKKTRKAILKGECVDFVSLLPVHKNSVSSNVNKLLTLTVNGESLPISFLGRGDLRKFPSIFQSMAVKPILQPHTPASTLSRLQSQMITSVNDFLTKLKPHTPVNVDLLESYLEGHPNPQFVNFLCSGLREGFHIGYSRPRTHSFYPNLHSANLHPGILEQHLLTEVLNGHTAGPFLPPLW